MDLLFYYLKKENRYKNDYLRNMIAREMKKHYKLLFFFFVIPLIMALWGPGCFFVDKLLGGALTEGYTLLRYWKEAHPFSMVIGSTVLVITTALYYSGDNGVPVLTEVLCPECGRKMYTQDEVDEQANHPDSVMMTELGIILTPKLIIGFNKGVKVIGYEEIKNMSLRSMRLLPSPKQKEENNLHYELTLYEQEGRIMKFQQVRGREDQMLDETKYILARIREANPNARLLYNLRWIEDPESEEAKEKEKDKEKEKGKSKKKDLSINQKKRYYGKRKKK